MLEYDMIYLCERFDTNRTKESRRCVLRKYYYFLRVNFRFQPKTCDVCHDLMQKTMSFNEVAIVLLKKIVI